MRNQIKIKNPCTEKWESMKDSPDGKICDICTKNIIDFTQKTNEEIQEFLNDNRNSKICGKISYKKFASITAGIILMVNVAVIEAQSVNSHRNKDKIAMAESNTIIFSGILLDESTHKFISGAEIYFIHLKQYIKASSDENGNFSMSIPREFINKENVIYIDFEKLNSITVHADITSSYEKEEFIIKEENLLKRETYKVQSNNYTIGAVVLTIPTPPDYHYFDGKRISKSKFEKIRMEKPKSRYFIFKDRTAKIIANKNEINTLYLLFPE